MKRIYLAFIILSLFITCCSEQRADVKKPLVNTADTTTSLLNINIASTPLLKSYESVAVKAFTIYNNTLFIINEGKLVEVDLKTGKITLNKVVTDFIEKLPKDSNYVSQITVAEDGYYLTAFPDLYHITTNGVATKIYSTFRYFEDVYVLNDNLIFGSIDSVGLISKNGNRLDVWSFPYGGSNGYIKGETGIYFSANGEDSTLEFQSGGNNRLLVKSYPPIAELTKIKEAFLSYVSDKYFIVFPCLNRNVIYAIKKDPKKLDVYKTITVKGVNLTPMHERMMDEEGDPNIKIGYWNNTYYILSVIQGKLKVLSFTV